MINSVSAVNFKSHVPNDAISRPGSFTKPAQTIASAPKKGGFWKGLAKLAAAVVVVGGALLLGYKIGVFKILNEADKAGAGVMKKAGHYLGEAGKWVDAKVWQKIPGTAKKAAKVS